VPYKDYEKQKASWRRTKKRFRAKYPELNKQRQEKYIEDFVKRHNIITYHKYRVAKLKDPNYTPTKTQLDRIEKVAKLYVDVGYVDAVLLKERYNLTTHQVKYLTMTKCFEEKVQMFRNIEYTKALVVLLAEVRRKFYEQLKST